MRICSFLRYLICVKIEQVFDVRENAQNKGMRDIYELVVFVCYCAPVLERLGSVQ